jgi:Zn finger protein HypA/HybF involved in hydrogenase expression
MHDAVIANSILKDLKSMGSIKKAYLEVGELFGIEPDHLLEHLKEISSIEFDVRQTASKVKCTCGFTGQAKVTERLHDMVFFECPQCNEIPEVISGDNIIIRKVER